MKRSPANNSFQSTSVPPIVRCAIYTRVSTDDQARGEYNSLESQRDICEHAIAVHAHEGWKTTLYLDDPGYSGKNLERPGMQALIQEVKAGQVDVVVAYKLDRITRYLPDFYEFWKVLNQHKVNFVSATQSFDTGTPMGMLMLNMLLSFGQFEREMIAERVSHKIAERAKKGLWNGGWAPLGYTHDPVTKQIHPNPVEAPVARRVFELSRELLSAAKVAKALNAEGLRTPERTVQSRRGNEMVVGGKRFIPNKIKVIVTNPLYKGIVHHHGEDYPGEHEALVSEKLWQEANDALSGKQRNRKHAVLDRNMHQTLLKGIIRCGECGHRLTPKPGGKKDRDGNPYLYYTCNNVSKDGKAATCSLRNVPARAMDDFVIQILGEIGRRPEIIKAAVATSNEEKSKSIRPLKTKLAQLQRQHTDMSEELQRYLTMVRKTDSAHFGRETLAAAEDLAKQKHELEREIEKVKIDIAYRERAVTDEHLVAKNLLDFEKTIGGIPFEEQCDLLKLLLRQVRVNRIDPEKEPIPGNPHTWSTKIRTQWFAVNLDLYASDLVSRSCETPTGSSHLALNGGEGGIRTHGNREATPVFKTGALNRSATSPLLRFTGWGLTLAGWNQISNAILQFCTSGNFAPRPLHAWQSARSSRTGSGPDGRLTSRRVAA